MNETFLVGISPIKFTQKPNNSDVGRITKSIKPQAVSFQQLSYAIQMGKSIRPAITDNGEFVEQSAFFLDFDDGATAATALATAGEHGLSPAIMYYTFSHSDSAPTDRFRMVFLNERPITDIAERTAVMNKLLQIYGGILDTRCRNVGRLFYAGRIFFSQNIRIDLPKILSITEDDLHLVESSPPKPKRSVNPKMIAPASSNAKLWENRNFKHLHDILNAPQCIAEDKNKAIQIMLQYPLQNLLGLPTAKSFCCIFHTDSKPSASIFYNTKAQKYQYKCFSSKCSLRHDADIFGIVRQLYGMTFDDAYHLLLYLLNITVIQMPYTDQLQHNYQILQTLYDYPTLKDTLARGSRKTVMMVLEAFHTEAQRLIGEKHLYYTEKGKPFLFISARKISQILNGSPQLGHPSGSTSCKINLLCYLGLITKPNWSTIPDEIISASFNLVDHTEWSYNPVNYYSIPFYSPEVLAEAEHRAICFDKHNYSITNTSNAKFQKLLKEADYTIQKL